MGAGRRVGVRSIRVAAVALLLHARLSRLKKAAPWATALPASLVLAVVMAAVVVEAQHTFAAPTCTVNWTGAGGDGAWVTAANWNPSRVPTASDFACIPASAGAVSVGGANTVLGVDAEGAGLSVPGSLALTDTTQDSTVNNLSLTGFIGGPAKLTLKGAGVWSGGTLGQTGPVVNAGTLSVAITGSVALGGNLLNQGTITQPGGNGPTLCLADAVTLENSGTFNIGGISVAATGSASAGRCPAGNASGRLLNDGTGTITGNGDIFSLFDNAGLVTLGGGTLRILNGNSSGQADTGTYQTTAGLGSIDFRGGTRNFATGATVAGGDTNGTGVYLHRGVLTGTLNLTGEMYWGDRFDAGGTFAAATLTGPGRLHISNQESLGGNLVNRATIDQLGGGALVCLGDGVTFENAGTLNVGGIEFHVINCVGGGTAGSGRLVNDPGGTISGNGNISSPFDNAGLVTLGGGQLIIHNGNSPGQADTGTYQTVAGQGSIQLGGGTRNFAVGATIAGGDATGTGVTLTGGALTGTLNLTGHMYWTGGTFVGATLTGPGGLRIFRSGVTLAGNLLNRATIDSDQGSPSSVCLADGVTFENAGTFNIVGMLTVQGGGGCGFLNNTGRLVNDPGGTIVGNGDIFSPFDNAGTLTVNSGTMNIRGPFSNYDQTTKTLTGGSYQVLQAPNGRAGLAFANADVAILGAAVVIAGRDAAITDLSFSNAFRDLAMITSNGSLTLRDDATQLVTSTSLGNQGTLSLGPGTRVAISVAGSYAQSSTATLQVDTGGSSLGQLSVSGLASLDGTLAIVTPGGVPGAQSFTVLNAALVSGTFSAVTGSSLSGGQAFHVRYLPTAVQLVVGAGAGVVTGTAQCGTSPLPGANVQLFSGSSLVFTTTADESGQFAFPSAAPGVYTVRVSSGSTTCGYQVTITPSGTVAITTTTQCPPDSLHNHSWITASPLDALGVTPAAAKVDACLYRQDQSAWFKVPIQPGSRVVVSLTNLPANYDLTLYKDIAGAYQTLTSPSTSLLRLSAEFAPDAYSPDAYSPDAYSPDAYSPDAYSPDAYSPDAYSPDAYSPDAYSPDAYSPDAYSPDAYSPDAYSPSAFSPDAYSPATPVQNALIGTALAGEPVAPAAYAGAQTRSLIGVSANNGTASEHIVRNTWDNATNFYVRVRGRNGVFNLAQPFHLEVTLLTGECGAIKSVDALMAGTTPSLLSGTAGSFNTVVLWDSSRASRLAGWTAGDLSAVTAHLASLASRTAGAVVDVSGDDRVKAANLQADANSSCPYAKNLVGLEIRRIVDAYRGLNSLKYVVIVGSDSLIPFFRHPDQAGLASERNFVPPVADASPSQASLKLGYVLSQDRYGSSTDLSVNDHTLPLPDLAVGRLIERPADIDGLIDAYLKAPSGGVTPTSSLATGYDFFADAATAIAGQLTLGTTHPTDTLIQSSGPPTVAGGAWTADQLRAKLLGSRHDMIFLGAHFSAFSAEAADFSTHLLATEVANSTLDWSNVVVFSEGCHSGYNTVDRDAIPIPLVEPDFPQAFAQQHATVIAGSGYQYGDTDFIEYGERLYLEFSKQLRTGTGPVSVGQALVAAKKAYLRDTPQLRGIHEKTLLESTLYGLPQLMVNMPGSRITPPADTSVVGATTSFENKPGSVLGLSSADITVQSTLTQHTVTINSTTLPPAPLTATYLSGSNGQVANPSEPVLPLEARNVTAPGPPGSAPILRGVGFRGGSYSDNPTGAPVLPLTDAPATELRGLHSFFFSSAFYPIRPWRVNYFDALTGGAATRLDVTPAQYLSSGPASQTGTLRAFSSMNFRLYYSDPTLSAATYGQTATYPGNIPALAAAPAISQVSALPSPDGQSIAFRVHVEGDPSAGIQQVWVTYTATVPTCSGGPAPCAGQWQSLDLVQDAADSTLWTATLPLRGTASGDVRYLAQAVNGVGVVGMATNLGAFYVPGPDTVPPTAPKQSTSVALSSPPTSGTYRDRATFTAVLRANGTPVAGRPLVFEFGPQRLQAVTDASGSATVTFPLLQTPGQYQVRAALEEAPDLLGSASESVFTITPQNTALTLTGGTAHYSDPTPVVTTLSDHSAPTPRRLREQTVVFIVTGNNQPAFVLPVITDELGRAPLGPLPLPAGTYTVAAYFSGTIPIPTATGVAPLTLTNDRYNPATTTLSNGLIITPELATVIYTGDTIDAMNSPIHVAATVTQETDDFPGDITNAQVEFVVKDGSGTTVRNTTAAVLADGTASASLAGLPAGLYGVESKVAGGFYTSPTTTALLAVFNPSTFVTGGGWIPSSAAAPNDKTNFGLTVKYLHGSMTPTGNVEVMLRDAGVDFLATSFDWLVITGSTAQFQGTGTVNGSGSFSFRVIATTGASTGQTFEIRIWDALHSFETPLYLARGTLGGGEITIHS